ncbi:MAG TPA: hypothetical protein VF814_11190 [Casimicrobiaceae bacterium]
MERYVHSFGSSFAVAAVLTALEYLVKGIFPGFAEWSEVNLGHAWLVQAVLGLVIFVGLGFAPIRWTQSARGLAILIGAATVVSGAVILVAAMMLAYVGYSG